ncbi:spexin prohormone 2-like [Brachyistius frenatus]|uniref:spexin prohormone 2-like n=1 Tax=Brachyistius frenatus TaxID=100188 RepID=UPI0037E7AD85
MKRTVAAVWTCTVVLSLFLESCHTQKLNVHWGPQSMMYLKGKHGRRFVSEDEEGMMKHGLQGWYAVIRGIQRLQSLDFKDLRPMVRSEKVLIQYFRER